jgi:aspartate/methionine/tyrosine aminotransferase
MYLLSQANVATVTGEAFGNQIASVFLMQHEEILTEALKESKKFSIT